MAWTLASMGGADGGRDSAHACVCVHVLLEQFRMVGGCAGARTPPRTQAHVCTLEGGRHPVPQSPRSGPPAAVYSRVWPYSLKSMLLVVVKLLLSP